MIGAVGAPPAHIIAQQGIQPAETKDLGKKSTLDDSLKEDNISSGELSENSAQNQLTTPSNDSVTELTRQEAVSDIQFRITQNALDQSGSVDGVESDFNNNAVAVEADSFDSEVAQNSNEEEYVNSTKDTSQNNAEEIARQKQSAVSDIYMEQSLFFTTTEDLGFSINA